MKCPQCRSEHIRKNGTKKGKQNHICAECGRQFINPSEQTKAFPETINLPEVVSQWHGIQGYRKSDGSTSQSLIGFNKKAKSYLMRSPQRISPMLANGMSWKHLSDQKKQDLGVDSSRPFP
jgi:hypothetical protein